MEIRLPIHRRERRGLRKRSGGVTHKLDERNKMLSRRRRDRLELYRHETAVSSEL
jgi:hypothetical protein